MADMKDQMKTGIDNLANLGKKAVEASGETINRVGEVATRTAETVQDRARRAADQVADTARQGLKAAEGATEKVKEYGDEFANLVRRYPLQALLVGFGVGYLCSRACR